ncbi:glycosyl hydrolase family 5 [Chryseobacterium nematophagum]|uniref:Glycosyl hydrolase family 5 n=1 Tax=Chryseobacterium nematophagum TaxID=2305228 RepID=A0A3M7TKJ5_9FLAO|nr:cellulase family glycosylhydrolase [Chryseobacterium nematophagum]RNA60478.1 glycosyl hydrolase family 5 [Chryseobacterium nematophagum]RNA63965.1 glycosyl hydrolase family 5 [Chryseobacterium nematophagum]RNA63989.1 glycosyl hydrolase family 5 [Chryseobacterium nematophagum]
MFRIIFFLSLILSSFLFSQYVQPIDFWKEQKKGANFFSEVEKQVRFHSAKQVHISFVRMGPNKWRIGNPKNKLGNFLIGPQHHPSNTPNKEDIKYLKSIVSMAHKEGVPIILTMLSLPYSRWSQHAQGEKEERKIWEDFKAQEEAIFFWKQLARELKGHKGIVALNIRNEPSPERARGIPFKDWYTGNYEQWNEKIKGTPQDLNLFYKKVVSAIREVDKNVPIVLDSGFFATPWGFKILEAVKDENGNNDPHIIYSFHSYEPYNYSSGPNCNKMDGTKTGETSKAGIPEKCKYHYPGMIPTGELLDAKSMEWNKETLSNFLQPVHDFQKRNGISSNRILVGEFGVYRTNPDAEKYMKDMIEIFDQNKWHWAFYGYREDNWDKMDYELGTKRVEVSYWDITKAGRFPLSLYEQNQDNPLWKIITTSLKNQK